MSSTSLDTVEVTGSSERDHRAESDDKNNYDKYITRRGSKKRKYKPVSKERMIWRKNLQNIGLLNLIPKQKLLAVLLVV
ncbi:hypothetical protein [Actinobacillus lignieresii]|uniref:Uncharacterized protein n=1 Tax=Actinobacillus lignieresii TaxID=720 RepID=A0A380U4K5_ACTLI|nr:hypothetical protein [Actinobacillus lignieresii]SUT96297.1 Uncharacterised protein [Actinobacillus lignieresii]SUU00905.1 Uncharacterised protein [Actinobacillus lignieresii]VEB27549.1 Uncharacterised protein [Actinobacillus lignieresii]